MSLGDAVGLSGAGMSGLRSLSSPLFVPYATYPVSSHKCKYATNSARLRFGERIIGGMTYPIVHKLLTIGGTSYASTEEWQFGMRIIPETVGVGPSQAQIDALATPITTFWNSASIFMPTTHSLTFAKLAPIGINGHYPDGEIAYEHVFTSDPGPGGGPIYPAAVALVVGLMTAAPRGRGHAGRFYLPGPASAMTSAGLHSSGIPTAVNAAVRTLINAINGAADVGTVGVITSLGSGTSRAVTAVRCGERPDIQRRRAGNQAETYQTLAL